jgi:hypothetical protein
MRSGASGAATRFSFRRSWAKDMTKAQRNWLLNRCLDGATLMAEADSPDDKKLQAIEKAGAIKHYDAMFGNNYYAFTKAGRATMTSGNREGNDG